MQRLESRRLEPEDVGDNNVEHIVLHEKKVTKWIGQPTKRRPETFPGGPNLTSCMMMHKLAEHQQAEKELEAQDTKRRRSLHQNTPSNYMHDTKTQNRSTTVEEQRTNNSMPTCMISTRTPPARWTRSWGNLILDLHDATIASTTHHWETKLKP
jgi:hypothetical protein